MLAENKRLTEKNPSRSVKLNFDRLGETRIKDKFGLFMPLNLEQSDRKVNRSRSKGLSSWLMLVFTSAALFLASTISYHRPDSPRTAPCSGAAERH